MIQSGVMLRIKSDMYLKLTYSKKLIFKIKNKKHDQISVILKYNLHNPTKTPNQIQTSNEITSHIQINQYSNSNIISHKNFLSSNLQFQLKFIHHIHMTTINEQCNTHMKKCTFFCTYSKCNVKILCDKCRRQHLEIHPDQFIFQLDHLKQVHSFDKINKLKQMLLKDRVQQQARINKVYQQYGQLLKPLIKQIGFFNENSIKLIRDELSACLKMNKTLIQTCATKIHKSQTQNIKKNPNLMLQETIAETQLVNNCEVQVRDNMTGFKEYFDATSNLSTNVVNQIKAMVTVSVKLLQTSLKIQQSRYSDQMLKNNDHHEMSFHKRYYHSHEVAFEKNKLEGQLIAINRQLSLRDKTIGKTENSIKQKMNKIHELQAKVEGLQQQLLLLEKKKQLQEKEKIAAEIRLKNKKFNDLIKEGIIGPDRKCISLQKKNTQKISLALILQNAPNPIVLDLSSHKLKQHELQLFLQCHTIQTFKYNFNKKSLSFLIKALKNYPQLQSLELNSCFQPNTEEILIQLAINLQKSSPKLKSLSLIDNGITDESLEKFFQHFNANLDSLYLSYNQLTNRSVEIVGKKLHLMKNFHIAKNKIEDKGANVIGSRLKQLQELFIGSCSIKKQGLLAICRNCLQLKRLSLVANEVSTEVISQILLGIKQLEWLDISYCKLTKQDEEKVQKLKIFNKNIIIVTGGQIR